MLERLAAVVVDLGEDRHVVGVDRVGDAPVAGDDRRVEPVDELLVGPVGRMGRVLLGDDQAGPAGGPGPVVGGVLLGGQAVLGVVGQVGGEDDPVGHGHRPDAERREQLPVGGTRAHRISRCSASRRAGIDGHGEAGHVPRLGG